MAASQTVAQSLLFGKSVDGSSPSSEPLPLVARSVLKSRRGVVTLHGYGISVRVERGHLVVEDGVGSDRYKGRFPRVGHGLERLVVVGADGVVSLSALRWLADQNASFVMLERDGTVLATTGPVRPSDIRLRRAQALAHQTGVAFRISRELIDRKLAGQERVARESLRNREASFLIKEFRSELAEVESIDAIRFVESRAAKAYWKAWQNIRITFPGKDLSGVPEHWRRFDSRASPLSSSPRLAANPVNAILNYLYALLEVECRLAVAALGLDPEMGLLHMDTINRDSLACDLMEPIRPDVDAYVLERILRQPLKRNWFFEERNGNCRLMADLVSQLAQTASTWARLVAPLAEWVVKEIASTTKTRRSIPATRLTQNHKRALTGGIFDPRPKNLVKLPKMCNVCGNEIQNGSEHCRFCAREASTHRLTTAASKGRFLSHSSTAEAKRSKTRKANHAALREWSASDQPAWLTAEFYAQKIQPLLIPLSSRAIARQLTVSRGYANEIRHGRLPHPRHWQTLATLLGLPE
jgi:CRISPR-associated endonuclease Cas1